MYLPGQIVWDATNKCPIRVSDPFEPPNTVHIHFNLTTKAPIWLLRDNVQFYGITKHRYAVFVQPSTLAQVKAYLSKGWIEPASNSPKCGCNKVVLCKHEIAKSNKLRHRLGEL